MIFPFSLSPKSIGSEGGRGEGRDNLSIVRRVSLRLPPSFFVVYGGGEDAPFYYDGRNAPFSSGDWLWPEL